MWSTRPAEMIGLQNDYVAYCFDDVVYTWGVFVENEMEKASKNAKKAEQREKIRNQTLNRLLQKPDEVQYKSFRPG